MLGSNLLQKPFSRWMLLGGLGLFLAAAPVSAQSYGGGGSSGGGAGGSGLTPFSSGNNGSGGGAQSFDQGLFGGLGGNVIGPSTANPFKPYYANPYSIGMPSQAAAGGKTGGGNTSATTNVKPTYGQPLFTNTVGGSTGSSSGSSSGTGSSIGSSGSKTGSSTSFGSSSSGLGSSSGVGSSSGLGNSSNFGSSNKSTNSMGSLGGNSSLGGANKSFGSSSTGGLGGTGIGGLGGNTGMGGNTGTTGNSQGFNIQGAQKTPAYVTNLGTTIPVVQVPVPGSLHYKVGQVIQLSSKIPSKNNIQVGMDGQTVVLTGTVLDNHERLLTEAMIRMTPGVKSVQNNLVVQGTGVGSP